eukprot:7135281-Ditylum_brightwellii.AAC.1
MEKIWAHMLVECSPVMLGVEVTNIVFSWRPVDQEISLRTAVADPVKAHVNCAGVALVHGGIDDSTHCGVIVYNWGGRLGVPHLGEGKAYLFSFSCVGE